MTLTAFRKRRTRSFVARMWLTRDTMRDPWCLYWRDVNQEAAFCVLSRDELMRFPGLDKLTAKAGAAQFPVEVTIHVEKDAVGTTPEAMEGSEPID